MRARASFVIKSPSRTTAREESCLRQIFVWLLIFLPTLSIAHPGRTDGEGCHREGGVKHCHGNEPQVPPTTEPVLEVLSAGPSDAPEKKLVVMSWNIKHLGRKSLDPDTASSFLQEADIITLQEVNKSSSGNSALQAIAASLAKRLGKKICWGLSEVPSEDSERYAYLWRDTAVAYVKSDGSILPTCPATALTIRLGSKHHRSIRREPAYGLFYSRHQEKKFVLASIHLVPTKKKPQLEVEPLFDTFSEEPIPVIVAGDYNLDSSHPAFFAARKRGFLPAMAQVKTSLKRKKRELGKAYDNFWSRGALLHSSKVVNLFKVLPDRSVSSIYNDISDHCPIQGVFTLGKSP